jgi:hypothetical protein
MSNLLPVEADPERVAEFHALTGARLCLDFEPLPPGDFTLSEREARAARLSAPACMEYGRKLEAAVLAAVERARQEGSISPIEAMPDLARSLDAEFATRLAQLGVEGHHVMQLEDGCTIRLPAFFEEVIAALAPPAPDKGNRTRL